jgi:hypothetical protein
MRSRSGRLLHVRHHRSDPSRAVETWKATVAAAWGGERRLETIDAVSALVESALGGATSLSEALTALGHRAGFDGHPLVEVADWISLLIPLAPRRAKATLRAHRSAYVLAEAWAAGRLAQVPPSDGESLDHLELRLGEVYEHCTALGLAAEREVALAVVVIDGLPGCEETRRAELERSAELARGIFTAGESVVVLPSGRVLVLAERSKGLPIRTRRLAHAIEAGSGLETLRVRHWIEPLPADRTHLPDHLRLLVA